MIFNQINQKIAEKAQNFFFLPGWSMTKDLQAFKL